MQGCSRCVIKVKTELKYVLFAEKARGPATVWQVREKFFFKKAKKTSYKTLAVQEECIYSTGPLSTETTEIHRVSIKNIIMETMEKVEPADIE